MLVEIVFPYILIDEKQNLFQFFRVVLNGLRKREISFLKITNNTRINFETLKFVSCYGTIAKEDETLGIEWHSKLFAYYAIKVKRTNKKLLLSNWPRSSSSLLFSSTPLEPKIRRIRSFCSSVRSDQSPVRRRIREIINTEAKNVPGSRCETMRAPFVSE